MNTAAVVAVGVVYLGLLVALIVMAEHLRRELRAQQDAHRKVVAAARLASLGPQDAPVPPPGPAPGPRGLPPMH